VSNVDLKIVFELLKEVREDQKKHGIELAKQTADLDNLKQDVRELKTDVSQNTDDLAHHIRRTDLLQELHRDNQDAIQKSEQKIEENEARLDKLEEPVKAKEWIKTHIVTISAVVTALASIAAFLIEKFGSK
jgi:chromosome segregation ATPase